MTQRPIQRVTRHGAIFLLMAALASCVSPPKPAPAPPPPPPRPAPPPPPPPPPVAMPRQDWRDVPLTPGRWVWRGVQGQSSLAQYGEPGQPLELAMRCDFGTRTIVISRAGVMTTPSASMMFTTSFGTFALNAANGGGTPPGIVAQMPARDPRLDQLAFSRGRFLVDVGGLTRLVLPAWPEVARVIEDCR